MKNILLICMIFICGFVPAQKIGVFIESGTTINQPLKKLQGAPIDWNNHEPQYYSKAYTTCGYYFKAGVDLGIVHKKNWTLGVPAGFSYMNITRKDYSESTWWGDDFLPNYSPIVYTYNKTSSITGFIGPQFKVSCHRMSVYSNIMLNAMKAISNRDYNIDPESGKRSLGYVNRFTNSFWNSFVTSYGLGVQYKMKACTLGINSDLYFMHPFAHNAYNSPMPFMGNRVWINPGIRLQYNLK